MHFSKGALLGLITLEPKMKNFLNRSALLPTMSSFHTPGLAEPFKTVPRNFLKTFGTRWWSRVNLHLIRIVWATLRLLKMSWGDLVRASSIFFVTETTWTFRTQNEHWNQSPGSVHERISFFIGSIPGRIDGPLQWKKNGWGLIFWS